MKIKKLILILLFLFSIFTLIIIVYSAKSNKSFFRYFYNKHVERQSEQISRDIKFNLDQMIKEVKYLAEDNIVKSIFVSATLGESTERYSPDFEKIKAGLGNCDKIQAIDSEGKIIFSTMADEINAQKIKSSFLDRLKSYFATNTNVLIYFMEKGQFVSIANSPSSLYQGYMAVYYSNNRLLNGKDTKNVTISFSSDNFVFLSSGNVDKKEMNQLVNYYNNPENQNKKLTGQNIGQYIQYNGLKMIYYMKNDKNITAVIIAIPILLLNFLLMGLVIFALIQTMKEERMYREVSLSSFDKDFDQTGTVKNQQIKDLVDDIEDNQKFDETYAKQGIEEMILSNDIDLTKIQDENIRFDETDGTLQTEETDNIETLEMPAMAEKPSEESFSAFTPEASMETEVQPMEFELENIPEAETKPLEFEAPAIEELNTYESIVPSKETDIFAEHDRIMEGIDNSAFQGKAPELNEADFPTLNIDEMEDNISLTPATEEAPGLHIVGDEDMGLTIGEDTSSFLTSEEPIIGKENEPFTMPETIGETQNPTEFPMDVEAGLQEEMKAPQVLESAEIPSVMEEPITLEEEPLTTFEMPEMSEIGEAAAPIEEFIAPPVESAAPIEGESVVMPIEDLTEAPLESAVTQIEEFAVPPVESAAAPVNLHDVFANPPEKVSLIETVEDYGRVAFDIAKNSLNINKIMIMERKGGQFESVIQNGFGEFKMAMDANDPVFEMFLSRKKSLDIKGDLSQTRYLKERMPQEELEQLEEILLVPVVKQEDVIGLALYAREKGVPEASNFQKLELYNLGFLQEK